MSGRAPDMFVVPTRLEDLPALLTPQQTAAVLQVQTQMIYDLISSQKLRAVNIGHGKRATYRVLRENLIDYVRGDTNQAPDGRP